eukprot:2255358-Rhodomonas_salina.1
MKLEAWGGEGRRLALGGLRHKIHYSDHSDQSRRCSLHPSLFPVTVLLLCPQPPVPLHSTQLPACSGCCCPGL